MAKLKPLNDLIVAKLIEAEEKTSTGILLVEDAREKPDAAEVVSVGPDVKLVKKGDHIIYGQVEKYLKDGKKNIVILKEENILATVK